MITKLSVFASQHVMLISTAFLLLITLGIIEYLMWLWGSQSISTTKASLLIERHHAKVLDFRTKQEFIEGHLPNAIHIDAALPDTQLKLITLDNPVILISKHEKPSFKLSRKLRVLGFSKLYHLEGGVSTWQKANLPIIRSHKV